MIRITTPRIALLSAKRHELLTLWIATAVIAALGDWLAFDALPGINWLLWTVAAAAGFVLFQRVSGKPLTWQQLLPLALACVVAGGAAVTANPAFHALIFVTVATLAAVATLIARGTRPEEIDGVTMALSPLVAGVAVVSESAKRAMEAAELGQAQKSIPVLRGGMIATPVIMVFALLLSAADPTFAGWRDGLEHAIASFTFIPRAIFFGVIGVGVLGAYGLALRPASAVSATGGKPARRHAVLSDTERLIVLGSVAALFALFFAVQLSYFFGDAGAAHGSGLTYADTVHRGFGELTACATLCALLIIVLDRAALRGSRERAARVVATVIIVETQLLLLSAFRRVDLYEAAYGYTTQRLYAQVYMEVVSIALGLLALEIWASIDVARLTRRTATTAVLALSVLLYWNHAAWIANRNVDRLVETGKIDLLYLTRGLGPDAMAAAAGALPRLTSSDAAWTRECLRAMYLRHSDLDAPRHAWYEWNARRAAIPRALRRAGIIQDGERPGSAPASPHSCVVG